MNLTIYIHTQFYKKEMIQETQLHVQTCLMTKYCSFMYQVLCE